MAYVSEQSRILKANDFRDQDQSATFNYDDFKTRCHAHVEQAQKKAQQLVENAREQTDQIQQQALKQGFNAGHQQGLQNAKTEIEQQAEHRAKELALDKLKTTLPAMQSIADQMNEDRNRWLAEWENATIKLAVAIAEKIIGQQIAAAPHKASDQIQQLLSLAVGSSRIRLHLNPTDLDGLGSHAEQIVQSLTACGEVQLCPDDSITAGGCLIETEHGTVDALIESQLQRITDELLTES